MFEFFTGKAPRDAHERLVRLANSSAMHMRMHMKDGDTFKTPHKTFNLSDDAERALLREAFLRTWMRIPKNRENWPTAMRACTELLERANADLYEVAAVHMVLGLLKNDYACEMALQYPRDRQMLDIAHKLVSMNSQCLHRITREQPVEIIAGMELPLGLPLEIMSDLPNCHQVSERILALL